MKRLTRWSSKIVLLKSIYLNLALDRIRKGPDIDKEVKVNSLLLTVYKSDSNYSKLLEDVTKDHAKYGTTKLSNIDPYSDDIEKDGRWKVQYCQGGDFIQSSVSWKRN